MKPLSMGAFLVGLCLSGISAQATTGSDNFIPTWYDNLYHLDDLVADGCKQVLVLVPGGSEVPYDPNHDWDQFRSGEVEAYLCHADSHGLKVILGVNWFLKWNPDDTEAQITADMEANMAALASYANAFASHPSLAGWYTLDEPPGGDARLAGLAARTYGILKAATPTLPVYMAFTFANDSPATIPGEYKDAYDVLMWDCYSLYRQNGTEYYAEWIDMEVWKKDFIHITDINNGFATPKPVMPILQGYGKPGAFPDTGHRLPSKNEVQYMVYYSANNGMRAVNFFYYNWLLDSVATPAPTPFNDTGQQWRAAVGKPVMDEMMLYAAAIDSGPVAGAVSGLASDINGKVYRDPSSGKYYLLTVKDSALVMHWKLDEAGGTAAADASGSGNTGTVAGGATWVARAAGGALNFDGVDDSVSRGCVSPGLGGGGNTAHTVAAWVKVNARPANRAWILLLGNEAAGSHCWLLNHNGTTQFGAWSGKTVQPVLPVGQWRHVAITSDGTTLKSYVNGALAQSVAANFNLFNFQGLPLTVAQAHLGENAFNGAVDDVRVYNRALTAAEVAQAMSASTPSAFTINLPGSWSHLAEYGAGNIPIVGNLVSPLSYSMYQVRNFELVPAAYPVTFDAQGGSAPNPAAISVTYGSAYGALATTTRTGYTFAGWRTGTDGAGTEVTAATTVTITTAQTLYATWTPNSYLVTFDAQGGTAASPASMAVTYGAAYGTLAATTRTGYTFGGWWTGAGGTDTEVTAITTVTITTAQTLYAKWTANSYMVTFDAAGGTVDPTSKTVTFDAAYGALAGTARTGYAFAGWWPGAGGTGIQVTATTIVMTATNHTLYAKWTYTVTFDAQGGTTPSPVSTSVTYGSTYGTLATTVRPGYTFAGWWTGAGGTGAKVTASTTATIIVGHTLYAKWTTNNYTVTFDVQGGTAASPASKGVTYGTTYGILATTTRAGYTFGGWWTGVSGTGNPVTASTTVSTVADHMLYAMWTGSAGDFTYRLDGDGVAIIGYTGSGGAVIIPPTIEGKAVTSIGDYAFFGCGGLTTVTIGSGVTSIGNGAFAGCPNLNGVYFNGNAPSTGEGPFDGDSLATVYYQPGATGWETMFAGLPISPWFPPIAATGAATGIAAATATLNGTINPNGLATAARFEYGLTVAYGNTAGVTLDPDDGTTAQAASAALAGLQAGTAYHYRLAATNGDGTAFGDDATFTTAPKGNQTITFPAWPAKTYGDADFAPGAAASSGLAVAYASSNPAVAAMVAGNVHIAGAGTATITASQPGNASWNAAAPVAKTLTVAKKTVAATAEDKTRPFGAANPAFSIAYAGLVNGDTAAVLETPPTATCLATAASGVGTYPIAASGGSDANYAFSHVAGSLTVTAVVPAVATAAPAAIGTTTATSGGTVAAAGGAAVTARGVCWSTAANPTVANARTVDGAGMGAFTSTLTKLSAGTTYYVRAYAANSAGTAYGAPQSFATPVSAGPDFVVAGIVLSPGVPAVGGKAAATITVLNQGSLKGKGGNLYVWMDKPGAAAAGEKGDKSASVSTLKPGVSKTVKMSLTAPKTWGTFTLRAFVDAKNGVKEDDEYNNQETYVYDTGLPDFEILAVRLSPELPLAGKTFAAYVTVTNSGNVAGNGGYLDVWADSSVLAATPVPGAKTKGNKYKTAGTLLPGQEKTIAVTGLKAPPGLAWVLGVLIDSRAKTLEMNEDNNWSEFDY